jgi:hypothetical protein
MPAVKKGEKQSEYVSRCVAYVVKNEGLDQKAALGKCYGMYKQSKKKKESKGDFNEPDFDKENNFDGFIFFP